MGVDRSRYVGAAVERGGGFDVGFLGEGVVETAVTSDAEASTVVGTSAIDADRGQYDGSA